MEHNRPRIGRPPLADPEVLRSRLLGFIDGAGYDQASMGSLAAQVGMSVRTLHRYFPAKADIVWGGIESSIETLTRELDNADDGLPVFEAVAGAVSRVFDQNAEDLAVMRVRLRLIALTPELRANQSATFEAWRHAIIGFVARRRGEDARGLVAVTAGTAVHTAILEALSWWALHSEATDPAATIAAALSGLGALSVS
ncbi:TetR family transcriptional regulator [Arthrobacter sp. 7Tela_A1]|uniref:acyl-CoA-like ligand-binding transcription factor n=1 Tax=Arthrobacter sp. 7Tela_A1 TaxID=3093745 RepID=UPI003BB4B718